MGCSNKPTLPSLNINNLTRRNLKYSQSGLLFCCISFIIKFVHHKVNTINVKKNVELTSLRFTLKQFKNQTQIYALSPTDSKDDLRHFTKIT
jgi:hypothetical protein